METTIVYRGYIGITKKKMEATIVYRVPVRSPGPRWATGLAMQKLKAGWALNLCSGPLPILEFLTSTCRPCSKTLV